MPCPNCGGSLIGDGITAVIHCENATDVDAIAEAEADAGPIYCGVPSKKWHDDAEAWFRAYNKTELENYLTVASAEIMRLRKAMTDICRECEDYMSDHEGENGRNHIAAIDDKTGAALYGAKAEVDR
jgi:hypothetical protein